MPVIFPDDNKLATGSAYPENAVDASEFARCEPLITPEQLKGRWLFGIPLVSQTVDPITRKAQVMTDEMLKDHILRACQRIEVESGFRILPVQFSSRMPFDRNLFLSFGYQELPNRPVLSIQKLSVSTSSGLDVYDVPNNWISPGRLFQGIFTVVPLQPAFLSSGSVPATAAAGGAAFLSILGQRGWIPEYWQIDYTAGFDEGKLPIVVNDIIGVEAAIDILHSLQATRTLNAHSIGVDGLSQSVQTLGPQVFQIRIQEMTEKKQRLMGKLRSIMGLSLFSSNI